MVKSFDIKIDIEKDIYSPMQIQFEVSNNDDSVELNFEFVQDDNPFDLTGQNIQLAVSNPSNKVFYQDVQIESPVDGKATIQLSNQGFNQAGLHVSEIYIRDVDNTIVTSPFYFNSRASLIQTETVPTGDGIVDWVNVLNKPSFFPPASHIHAIADVTGLQSALDSKANVGETGTGDGGAPAVHTHEIADVNGLATELDSLGTAIDSKADINHTHPEYLTDIPDEYLTQTEGDARYQASGSYLTDIPAEYLTETEGDTRYQASGTIPAHTHPEYLTDVPAEYLTESEGDTKYQPIGTIPAHDHPEYLTAVPPEYLTETEGDLKYQASGTYLTDIPPEYLTQTEGDARYQASGSIPAHDHAIDDVTGLQLALDGKMDDGDAYLKTETYSKAEVYNRTEIDQMTMGEGGGSPVIVEDNLMSVSTTNALSSNQGRILNETKADINHTHPEYLTDIPAEYLTATEGDALYQPKGTYLTDIPAEYLTETDGNLLYQPIGTYLTNIPAEYLTETEGDLRYQASGTIPAHDHAIADVTGLTTELDGKADVNHNHDTIYSPILHSHSIGDITGLSTTLDGKSDVNHTHDEYALVDHTHPEYLTAVPPEYLTATEGDALYQAIGTIPAHTHPEYLTSVPAEYLTETEGDLKYQPIGTYLTDIPADYLTLTEGDLRYQPVGDYLTSVPPEYLTQTEGDGLYQPLGTTPDHVHAEYMTFSEGDLRYQPIGNYLTDIPAEYLTATEGDLLYQPIGTIPAHDHPEYLTTIPAEYLTESEGNALYQPIGSYLTAIPPEYLTDTEGDLRYQAINTVPEHTHPEYLTSVPAEYLTETEGDLRYQPIGAGGTLEPHTHEIADVNGLQTALDGKVDDSEMTLVANKPVWSASVPTLPTITPRYIGDMLVDTAGKRSFISHGSTVGDWERIATTTYVDTADNYIINTILAGLSLWKGSQAEYDLLTPDANTLYFIVG